jgi:hypothetical protein
MGAEARSSELFLMEQALDQYDYTELAAKKTAKDTSNLKEKSKEVKLGMASGCTAYVSDTYQVFGFKALENAH